MRYYLRKYVDILTSWESSQCELVRNFDEKKVSRILPSHSTLGKTEETRLKIQSALKKA